MLAIINYCSLNNEATMIPHEPLQYVCLFMFVFPVCLVRTVVSWPAFIHFTSLYLQYNSASDLAEAAH